MRITPPTTVRFWIWENDGLIKISVKLGQTLNWHHHCRTEEGWSFRGRQWEWDGELVIERVSTDGTDCDGRLSTHGEFYSTPDLLKTFPAMDWSDQDNPKAIPGIFTPQWEVLSRGQRDYSAEAMNY